jgi:quinol monooxygenase YgiN
MIITQLEAKVSPEKAGILKAAFNRSLQQLPSAIEQSYLVQDTTDHDVWRVITIWKNREALQSYRQSVETPEGILMFRAAGAEPTLTIFDVISHS